MARGFRGAADRPPADRDPAISPERGHRYKSVIMGFGQRRGGGKGGGLDQLFCRI